MADAILWPGDEVEPGDGPIRCSASGRSGVPCRGIVGWPAVGSILVAVEVLVRGERLGACEEGFAGFRCQECGAVAYFGLPRVA